MAAVGAVILARRRSGLDDPRELSVADLLRSPESGTLTDAERGSLRRRRGRRGASDVDHLVPLRLGDRVLHRRRRRADPHATRSSCCSALELMLNAANLALVAFARAHGNQEGQIFALIVMVVAACEVAVGLGLIVALYRRRLPIDVDELRELQG